jgi:hypothetical protein
VPALSSALRFIAFYLKPGGLGAVFPVAKDDRGNEVVGVCREESAGKLAEFEDIRGAPSSSNGH